MAKRKSAIQKDSPVSSPVREVHRETVQVRWIAAIVLLVIVAYANSFSGVFLFDDHRWIDENPRIRSLWPITTVVENSNRPLGQMTFAINYAISGNEIWSYHAFNLLIHLGSTMILFDLARRTLSQDSMPDSFQRHAIVLAFAISAIWGVHPLQTQAVTYVVQRFESLMAFWFLLTLYAFVRGNERNASARWFAMSLFCCALGMATKEVMIAAPLIVLWYARVFLATSWKDVFDRWGTVWIGLFLCWGILAWCLFHTTDRYQNRIGLVRDLTSWDYFRTQPEVILHYIRLCYWPTHQCLDYAWPVVDSLTTVIVPGLLLIGLFMLTAWGLIQGARWSFLGGWFFLILAPSSSIVPIVDLAFEHRMYLPSIAVLAAGVLGLHLLLIRLRVAPRVIGIGLGMLLLILVAATHARNRWYHDEETMWHDVAAKQPHNPRAWATLAKFAELRGDQSTREKYLVHAKQLDPDSEVVLLSLGRLRMEEQRLDDAQSLFESVLRFDPTSPHAHSNLGVCKLILGELDEAEAHLRQAVQFDPDHIDARFNLAALSRQSDPERALMLYREILERQPDHVNAKINLAGVLTQLGRPAEGLEQFASIAQVARDSPVFYIERGLTYKALGQFVKARRDLQSALRLAPNNPEVLFHLAQIEQQNAR